MTGREPDPFWRWFVEPVDIPRFLYIILAVNAFLWIGNSLYLLIRVR